MKKIINVFLGIILFLIALYSIIIIAEKLIWRDKVPSLFGYKNFIVLSGSMEPTFHVGDLLFIKENDDIKAQDIITFNIDNAIVTHRVIEVVNNDNLEKEYVTKGDNNSSNDIETIKSSDIEGKYIFKISKIGNIVLFLKTKMGMFLLIVVFSISLWIKTRKKDKSLKKI